MGRVAVVVLLIATLVGCSDDAAEPTASTVTEPPSTSVIESSTTSTPVSTSTSTTASPPSTSSTIPPLPDPIEGWGRLDVDPEVFGAVTVTDGAAVAGRFVLVGCDSFDNSTSGFPVWWSNDAIHWAQAEGPEDVTCMTQIEASSFGYFATGGANQLHSEDGMSWEPLDLSDDFGFDYSGQLGAVFAIFVSPNDDRVTLLYSRAAEGESRIATLVTTTDGQIWQQGPADSAALFDSSSIAAVIEGGPGLIAVGSSPGGEFVPSAAAFVSSDGLSWTRATPRSADFDDKIMTDVIAYADRYVAVGGDFFKTGLMTAWTSPDGVQWTRSPSPPEELDPSIAQVTAEAITVAGGSLWAAGRDFDASRDADSELPAMWKSEDGVIWTRVDFDEVRFKIPFLVLDTADFRIGVWPPPNSSSRDPVQLFGAD